MREDTSVEDVCGRAIYNLRISVNQSCNFDCFFCHEEGEWNCQRLSDEQTLSPKQIETTVRVLSRFGIREVKITGGEPLQRDGIIEIIRRISSIEEIEDLSMTSNGYYLNDFAPKLKNAGLDRINVSLNSLDPDIFSKITHTNPETLRKVKRGLQKAKSVDLSPIKINFVALKGINIKEIPRIITFAEKNGFQLHLIEYHAPNEENELYQKYYYSLDELAETLTSKAEEVKIRKLQHRKKAILPDGTKTEFIRPMANPEFCQNCHRMRITSQGEFKPCLMKADNYVSFKAAFNSKDPENFIERKFRRALQLRSPHFQNSSTKKRGA